MKSQLFSISGLGLLLVLDFINNTAFAQDPTGDFEVVRRADAHNND
jgi:hypothetical protein